MRTRAFRYAAVFVALLVFVALECLSALAPHPAATARNAAKAHGWKLDQLSLVEYHYDNGLFGGSAQANYKSNGPDASKAIRIDLVRPAYSANWRVTDYHEDK